MKNNKWIFILVILAILVTSCAPEPASSDKPKSGNNIPDGVNEVVLPADDPNTIANNGEPVYVEVPGNGSALQGAVAAIYEKASVFPLSSDEVRNAINGWLVIDPTAEVRLCDQWKELNYTSIYVGAIGTSVMALEPGPAGEATVGAVILSGHVVAWIYVVTAAVAVTVGAKMLSDVIGNNAMIAEANRPAEAVQVNSVAVESAGGDPASDTGALLAEYAVTTYDSLEALPLPGELAGWDKVPDYVVEQLKASEHAKAHAVAECIAYLAEQMAPNSVYASFYEWNDNNGKVPGISLLLDFYGKKAIDDLGPDKPSWGVCSTIGSMIEKEIPGLKRAQAHLVLIVGFNPLDATKVHVRSAYVIADDAFNAHLCQHGFMYLIFRNGTPTFKYNPGNCPPGY